MGKIKKTPSERHNATASPAIVDFVAEAAIIPLHLLPGALAHYPVHWPQPRGDLYHWIPLLDRFDAILELFVKEYALNDGPQTQPFMRRLLEKGDGAESAGIAAEELDTLEYPEDGDRVLIESILHFTRILLERCGNRSLYESSKHLDDLLHTTSLSLLKACLELSLRLAQRYAVTRIKSSQQYTQSTLMQQHYHFNLDNLHKLAMPISKPRSAQAASQTPVRSRDKSSDTTSFNPSDLVALAKNDFHSNVRKELATVTLTYTNTNAPSKNEPQDGPSTPTPTRRQPTSDTPQRPGVADRAVSVVGVVESPTRVRDSYFPPPTIMTFELSPERVMSTEAYELVREGVEQVPKEQRYELLQRIRIAKAFASHDNSLQKLLEIRLLSIANLAYAWNESKFQDRIGLPDSNESRKYHLATQLCELLQPLHNGQRLLTLPSETIVIETLEALTRQKHKSIEVVDALAVSVNHGVLYYILRQAIDSLRVDVQDDAGVMLQHIKWRNAVFELVTAVSQSSGPVKCAEKMVAAGIIEILVEALTLRTSSAERIYEKVIGFISSFVHGIQAAFQAFANARGLEIITELANHEVTLAMKKERDGEGMPASLKSKVVDYTIPYYQQAALRSVFKFIAQLFGDDTGAHDRLLRNLFDSPQTLSALRHIISNANMFGSNVWHAAINTVTIFLNHEPTSFQIIAEAGLAKGILEAVTQKALPDNSAEYEAPKPYDPEVDDIRVVDGQIRLPTAAGILPTSEIIRDTPSAFGAICLNEDGMNMLLASGAIDAYFDIFLSPLHVRTIEEEGQIAFEIGNAFEELSRHHPGLQEQTLHAVIRLLKRVHSLADLPESAATAILQKRLTPFESVKDALTNRAPALPTISAFTKFLEGFLTNSSMCQKFCQSGSAVLVLDLITSPATPYDLSVLPVVSKMTLAFYRMTEDRGHLVLPELLSRLRSAVDMVQKYAATGSSHLFEQFVDPEKLSQAELPEGIAKALSNISVLCLMMAKILHGQQHGPRGGNQPQLLSSMNFTDVYASLIESLGKLHSLALRENSNLTTNTPTSWKPYVEIEPTNSRNVDAEGNIHTNVHCAHCGFDGMDGHEQFLEEFEDQAIAPMKLAAFRNLRMLRFVLGQMTPNIDLFFSSISQIVAPKRSSDNSQKRQAALVAQSLATAVIQWFEHPALSPIEPDLVAKIKCMQENVAGLTKVFLRSAPNSESYGAKEVCTLALSKFFNADGLQRLFACQNQLVDVLNSDVAKDENIRSAATVTLEILLLFLIRLCSSRAVNEASQSSMIAERKWDSPDYFNSNQFVVELRYTILKSIMPLWSSDRLLHIGAVGMKWVIEAMREIFKAEGEDKAQKRSEHTKRADLTRIDQYFRPPTYSEEALAAVTAKGFDQDLAAEACARCNNHIHHAVEYAELRLNHGGPRFPAADLEQYFKDSQQGSTHAGLQLQQPETSLLHDFSMGNSDSDDENMGSLGRLPADMMQQDPIALAQDHGFKASDVLPSKPTSKETARPFITIDDLNEERQKLRENLIDRCLDVLSVESDITFDLANLIQAAVSRSGESANPRAEWGSTLVSSLLSLQADGDETTGKKVAAYAHLVALVLQDRDFFDSTLDELKDNFDALLTWLQLSPEQNVESAPWVEMILLILEQVLAEDEQPIEIEWRPPPVDNPLEPMLEPSIPEQVVSDETREVLFTAVVDLLPKIGKKESLALSVTRVLVILTRRPQLAKRLSAKLLMSRLCVMVRQLVRPIPDKLQSTFMIILRHMIEDDTAILQSMKTEIRAMFYNPRATRNVLDTTIYARSLYQLVLRHPALFVQATKEMVEIVNYNGQPSRPQHLALKATASATSDNQVSDKEESQDPTTADNKQAQTEAGDSVVQFLLRELSNYRDVEDKTSTADDTAKTNQNASSIEDSEPAKTEKPVFEPKDNMAYIYRCFIMQCLTEILGCYTRTKVEFINFSRKVEAQPATPSRPRSGTINYLLYQLLPVGTLEHRDTVEHRKKSATSGWAIALITALCCQTFETPYILSAAAKDTRFEKEDPELALVRRFVLEHAIRAFKDALTSNEPQDMRYSRLLALADLFERMLSFKIERTHASHSGLFLRQAAQIGRLMYEKNFVGVLTSAIADLDLNFPSAKRAVKHILGPLKILTNLTVELSQHGELSSTDPSSGVEEDDLSSATSLSDSESVDEGREQTPDLFRNSTLGMYEASHQHDEDDDSEDDDDDDEDDEDDDHEMYEAAYDEEMDYEDGNGETISDEDEDEDLEGMDEDMGDIEGVPGDMEMQLEIIEGDSEDEDSSDDESNDHENDDDEAEGEEYYEDMEEVTGDDDNASLEDGQEDAWEDGGEYEHDDIDHEIAIDEGDALDRIAQIIGVDDPHGGFVSVAPDEDAGFFQDEMMENDQEDEEDGEEEYEAEFGYEPEIEEDDDDDAWGFDEGHQNNHINFRPHRRNHMFEDIFGGLMGHHQSGLGRLHRTHYHHHQHGSANAEDTGINPLLQRSDTAARDGQLQSGLPMFPPPLGRLGGMRMPAAFIQDFFTTVNQDGNPYGGVLRGHNRFTFSIHDRDGHHGNLQLPAIHRLLEHEFGFTGQASNGMPPNVGGVRSGHSDEAHAVEFRPASTAARWTDEAKILFNGRATDKAQRIINALLRALVPMAMETKRKQDEAERQAAEQRAREAAEQAEKEKREREEAEQQAKEAEEARIAAESEAAARAAELEVTEPADTQMSGTGAEEVTTDNTTADATPTVPRVTTTIRGQVVDITSLGIDVEYLQALPEEFREEVIMSQFAEQRSQAQQAGSAPDQISREFLEALPEDIQHELIRQENADRRRRERRERAQANEASGAAAATGSDLHPEDFLAMLEPTLRDQILRDVQQDQTYYNELPEEFQRQARDAALRDRPQRAAGSGIPRLLDLAAQEPQQEPERVRVRPVVQVLDKAGVATLLRLMFITLHQTAKSSLRGILADVCKNTQNRAEVISILLSILQDGTADVNAVERSFAQLSLRAKQSAGPKTPQPLKRSLTGQLVQPITDLSPLNIVHQCLGTLTALSNDNPKVQTFFLSEHETLASQKSKSSKKPKGKEPMASKYPLNALLTLLDRKLIIDNTGVMEILAGLLSRVTQPLQILAKKTKQAQEAVNDKAEESTSATTGDQMEISMADVREQKEAVGDDETVEKKKKSQRELEPPDVPEENMRLVINILAARECPSKTFSDTLDIIKHMSAIPGAKAIFGRELIRQASELGIDVVSDLDDLTRQINKARNGADVQAVALVSFSSAGSKQRKLLRILVALDYLFDARRMIAAQASSDVKLKDDILAALYESDTFQDLWKNLSLCLTAIRQKGDLVNVATVLMPLIESLMVVCRNSALRDASIGASQTEVTVSTPPPEARMEGLFYNFTEEHRKILNELIRNNPKLMNGNLSILAKNSKVLEFDNKRSYFNRKLHNRGTESRGQHPVLTLNVRRDEVFMDSYKALFFKSGEEIKNGKLNIRFNGEEGVDAGGVSREWFAVMARQMFNPDFALFNPVASDRTTFHPNRLSDINEEHLPFFKFIGRVIGKALYENRVLDCHFSRAVYRRILGKSVSLKDMESLDLDYYKSLVWILENDITDITFETFSVEVDRFGETRIVDLIPDGRNVAVTEENKQEYVRLVVEHRLIKSVEEQLNSFLGGFHEIIPAELIAIFNEQELELLISGLPEIDVDDWKNNTEYHNYQATSAQIQWFWRAVKSFDPEERAKLLQFVTGTSKVPLNGFKELEGMNGFARFNIHRDYSSKEKLPTSHTCFNQLDLPEYESYEHLRQQLYTAITAGSEYFGFA